MLERGKRSSRVSGLANQGSIYLQYEPQGPIRTIALPLLNFGIRYSLFIFTK